jgi:hypothetical protein
MSTLNDLRVLYRRQYPTIYSFQKASLNKPRNGHKLWYTTENAHNMQANIVLSLFLGFPEKAHGIVYIIMRANINLNS